MKERPIIFSGEMVKAILDGRKTQTRRAVKTGILAHSGLRYQGLFEDFSGVAFLGEKSGTEYDFKNPYGQIGDRLWVKEKHCLPKQGGSAIGQDGYDNDVLYAADEGLQRFPLSGNWTQHNRNFKWRPSIHMPRWASRIDLEITGVRVERVQEITGADAKAEGGSWDMDSAGLNCIDADRNLARIYFVELWDSINAKRGFGWEANPWVWVIGFKIVGRS